MRMATLIAVGAALLITACDSKPPASTSDTSSAATLELIKQWVHGNYNNVAQADADMAAGLPPELVHRPMHQLFARVQAPQLDGYILYQQSSLDGSETPGMIFRHGLMQYLEDTDAGVVRQRELYFKNPEPYKNAHLNPEILLDVTAEQLTWDEGCDFYLSVDADGKLISGPLSEGKCVVFNKGLQKNMYAEDRVEITADEYRFWGRYVDEKGNTLWGTESMELNRMLRQSAP